MRPTVDLPRLRDLMLGFHTLTGLKIVLFDAEYRQILAWPEAEGAFCRWMHAAPSTRERCLTENARSFQHCRETGELHIYHCHAGLLEATAPIVEDGVTRGYVMFGQITDRDDREVFVRDTATLLAPLGVDEATALAAARAVRSVDTERIHAAARIMEACVCYLLRHDVVALRRGRLVRRIDDFIDSHLAENLTTERLCAEFHVSRSSLFRLFADHMGDTPAATVRARRVERARRLLRETTLPPHRVGAECGFEDYDYFRRVFREETGLTPKTYREDAG